MPSHTPLLSVLLIACSVGGDGDGSDPTPLAQLTEEEVEGYVTDDPVDLSPGSTMGGSRIVTEDDLADLTWEDLGGIPADLLDGDDDTLAALGCAEGEWPVMTSVGWSCTDSLPLSALDTSAAAEGDVLVMTASGPEWQGIEEALGSGACPTGMVLVGDVCVESSVRGPSTWIDAVATCASVAAHLCTHAELAPACLADAVDPATNPSGLEWLADRTANGQAAVSFSQLYGCDATAQNVGASNEYRCCTQPG